MATTIVSAVSPILVRPLPYPDASRIVTLRDRGADGAPVDVTFGTYRELVDRARPSRPSRSSRRRGPL